MKRQPAVTHPIWTAKQANVDNCVEVWRCEAHNTSPRDAARQFTTSYFDRPRAIERDVISVDGMFSLVDGRAIYAIVFIPGVPLQSVDVFSIVRYDPA